MHGRSVCMGAYMVGGMHGRGACVQEGRPLKRATRILQCLLVIIIIFRVYHYINATVSLLNVTVDTFVQ